MSEKLELGVLGGVDHNANIGAHISVGMVGRKYRVVRSRIENGTLYDAPVDDDLHDSIGAARAAARAYLANAKARGEA